MKDLTSDVLVVGAGASGIPAAIAAARAGASVILIEEDPVIGGAVSDSYVDMYCGGPRTGVIGEAERMLNVGHRLTKEKNRFFLPASFLDVYSRLLRAEKNVTVLTGARAVDVLRGNGKDRSAVGGVKIEVGLKRTVDIRSEVTIDATGTGAVAILAGCESMYGRDSTGDFGEPHAPAVGDSRVQQCTWMYVSQQLPGGKPFDMMKLDHVELGVLVNGLGWYHHDPAEAIRLNPGIYLHWGCAVECGDTRDPVELGKAQVEAMAAMEHDLALLRANGYAVYLAPRIGVREASRIVGEHVITENDLRSGTLPADTVSIGDYGLDIWGGDISREDAGTPRYGIPYGALVPKDVDGLLLAGKIISGTHIAMSAYRVMPIVGSIGQAAGVAAALCAEQNRQPREMNPDDVREILQSASQNVTLGDKM